MTNRAQGIGQFNGNIRGGAEADRAEYDAAQRRGEIRKNGERSFSAPKKVAATEALSAKDVHEGRLIRDAEEKDLGVVRRALVDEPGGGVGGLNLHVDRECHRLDVMRKDFFWRLNL
jgi:hypothetical protein